PRAVPTRLDQRPGLVGTDLRRIADALRFRMPRHAEVRSFVRRINDVVQAIDRRRIAGLAEPGVETEGIPSLQLHVIRVEPNTPIARILGEHRVAQSIDSQRLANRRVADLFGDPLLSAPTQAMELWGWTSGTLLHRAVI